MVDQQDVENRRTEVSVVLPAYNEEDTIEQTVERTVEALVSFLPTTMFEVIIAEDGCTDRTPDIAARLAAEENQVRHVHSDERLGRGKALESAFGVAAGDTVVYFDTDLATDMKHLPELIRSVRSNEYDIATGSRWMPENTADRPFVRDIASRGYNKLVRLFLRSDLYDHQCGFKAFDRKVLFSLLDDVEDGHWFWDTEILVKAQRQGYRVRELPVNWVPKGDSKVHLVRDVVGMGTQILRTWWQLSVTPRITPQMTIATGVVFSLIALTLMTVYLDPTAILAELSRANMALVGAAALIYSVSWPVRGIRYRYILNELGFHEGVGFLTGAVFISQTGNLVFPARAGDAIRAYIVKSRRGIPYSSGFASLVVERLFDLLTITILAGTVFVTFVLSGGTGDLVSAIASADRAGRTAVIVAFTVGIISVLAATSIIVSKRSDRNLIQRIAGRLRTSSYAESALGTIQRFVGDLQRGAGSREAVIDITTISLIIWILDTITVIVVLVSLGVETGLLSLLTVSFLAVSVGNLAKVLPLSPGGIGLYEAAFTLIIVALTPITGPVAFGAAVIDHALKNIVTIVGGVVAMLVLNVSLTTAVNESADISQRKVEQQD